MITLKDLNELQHHSEKLCDAVEKDYNLILNLVPEYRRDYAKFLLENTENNNRLIGRIMETIECMMRDKD